MSESMQNIKQEMDRDQTMGTSMNGIKHDIKKSLMPVLMFMAAALIALYLIVFSVGTAFADQVTIVPDGVLGAGGWTGATVGNLSDGAGGGGGGDGTYATITGADDTFTVSMSNDAAYSGATINSVTVWVRANVLNGGGAGERITFGSTAPTVSTSGNNTLSDNPTIDNFQYAPTGLNTSGDVDSLEVGVNSSNIGGGEEVRIYEVWAVVDYTPVAAANELNACDACHNQPPNEEASRNGATGAVVGSHASHGAYTCTVCHPNNAVLNHRGGQGTNGTEGQIDMLANIQGGTYSLGSAGFIQDNEDGTGLGSCSDVTCHGGAASTTPQWGDATGLNCDGCHGAPPATNAHGAHYNSVGAAQGWASPDTAGTSCANCHPDNTATHSDVTDGIITVNAGLTPSGVTPAISCGNAPVLGCHNGKATPNWDTPGISCTQCHTAGGTDTADPVTGLHDENPSVSGVRHNPLDANFTGCEDCHSTTPSDNHWDGTFQNSAPTINFDGAATGFVDGTPPTCTSSCHNDSPTSGPWARKWHENSDLGDGSECVGCHGVWGNWNGGVTHRSDSQPETIHGTGTYKCRDCHALGETTGNTGYTFIQGTTDWFPNDASSNHGDAKITINNEASHGFVRGTGGDTGKSGCSNACHADGLDGIGAGLHSFATTNWTLETVIGDQITSGCDTCHGGSGQYWPNGGAYPNTEGRHDEHMTELSTRLGITLPGSDTEQKRMCQYCHNDPGGSGHSTDVGSDSIADDFDFHPIWDPANPPSAVDSGSAFDTGNGGCNSIACHNNQNTGSTDYGWRNTTTSVCTMCHTAGVAATSPSINPTTGLHDVTPTVSGQIHDQTLDASGCVICHTATPSSAHIDGNDDTSAPTITVAGSTGFVDGSPGTCNTNCHSDNANWARKWHENSTAAVSPTSLACAGCHGTFTTGFNAGVGLRHQTSTSGDADGDIEANHDGTDKCLTCHAYDGADGYGHTWATHHLDDTIQISDQVTFQDNGTTVGCAAGCHLADDGTGDEGHEFEDATLNHGWLARQFVSGPTAGCTGCHSAHGTGSAGVGPNSPHVFRGNKVGYDTFNACEDCHPGNTKGSTHQIGAGVVGIENNASVGINYGHDVDPGGGVLNGFALGGDATTGTTEAEICWNCHNNPTYQTTFISEWGLNTDTNGGTAANYDFGSLDQPNWVGATWTSAQGVFSYKTNAIQSTHAANSTNGVSGNDAVADIRCSYCHDVHDTADRTGVIATANDPDGAPFLRGNWKGNPYREDGAPRNGMSYSGYFGNVPRGAAINTYGGYQIDQNTNPNPTGKGGHTSLNWTADNSSGLCSICHGSNTNGTWNLPGDINALNQFGTASDDWVGTNGHANSTLGGDGTGAANIFRTSDRTTVALDTNGSRPDMGYVNHGSGVGYGFRGTDGRSFTVAPGITGNSRPYGGNNYVWNATVDDGTTDSQYHQFSCSKCHNPHASRLPRLMITNCLDTKQNTWDQNAGDGGVNTSGSATSNNNGITLSSSTAEDNWNRTWSNTTSAQNCHRVAGSDDASPAGYGTGWNYVTPW